MPKVDIYVKHPINGQWEILDLIEDESINLSFKLKDLNDIGKIFSTFSQDFVVPASNNNNKVFNYFFNTSLQRIRERGLDAKIYVNDDLFRTGHIIIKQGKYENYKLTAYSIEFKTVIGAIKDKVGEDLIPEVIGDILNDNYSINWGSQDVYDKLLNSVGNEDMLVPLVSINRVWSYQDGISGSTSDISNPANAVTKYELRPAIRLGVVYDLLIDHYDLNIDFPLRSTSAFNNLYLWLNAKTDREDEKSPVTYDFKYTQSWTLTAGGIPPNSKMFFDIVNNNGGMRITDTGSNFSLGRSYLVTNFVSGLVSQESGQPYKGKLTAIITQRETGKSFTVDIPDVESAAIVTYRLPQAQAGVVRTYDTRFVFDESVESLTVNSTVSVLYSVGTGFPSNRMSSSNNNLPIVSNKFNVKYAMGQWKVIDFFSSIFKMFNIRVVEDYDDFSMKWLTPDSFYNGNMIDVNKYTDVSEYTITPSTQYKQIQFKPTTESYFRNKEYKKLVNKDYGSEVFVSTDKALSESYTVESKFSLMNWFLLNKTSLQTSYGFDSPGSPTNPTTPTIFYNQGAEIIRTDDDAMNVNFRFRIPNASNPNFTNQLARYIKFGNHNGTVSTYTNSITYDIDINPTNNTPMTKSLYANFYAQDIERLYLPNSNYYNFEGYLSLDGIVNFSMQNFLTIEDQLYSIEEANIDITTGQFKFKLLNFVNNIETVTPIYPPTPDTFFADGGVNKLTGGINVAPTDDSMISHYEIQYRRQGDANWLAGVNVTYIPMTSAMWEILNVTPTGLYDVRARTVSFQGLTSDWVYDYSNNVTGGFVVGIPINVGDSPIKYDPCAFFPPTKIVKPWQPIRVNPVFSPVEFELIDVNTQLYLDEELTQAYIPSGTFKTTIGSASGLQVIDAELDLSGIVKVKKPCTIKPVKFKFKDIPFESVGSINRERWTTAPTVELWTDSALRVNSRFFVDEGLTIPANETIAKFNGKVMSAWFDIEPTDVRAFKVSSFSVADLAEPVDFEVEPPVDSKYIQIDRNIPFEKASDACQAFNTSWGGWIVNGYYQEPNIGEGVQLYEDADFTTPLSFPYPQWLPMLNNGAKQSVQINNNGIITSYGVC